MIPIYWIVGKEQISLSIYSIVAKEQSHTTIDSRELGIPSALPYTSLRILWIVVSIVPIGIALAA
jgi:hypothetical protein